MKRKSLIALTLATVMTTGILAGCGSSEKTEVKNKDLKLTIYCGLMEDHMVKVVEEFKAETGIQAEAVRMSSGEILGRLRAEKENPKASVWFGGPADAFIQAKEEALLENYVSPNADKIEDKFKDKEGAWTGIYSGYLGFVSNAKLLKEKGIEAPTSWQDLLKPEFKGQISIANPGSSGTAYSALATIVQLMGEEEGLKYMKALNENVKSYEKSGTAPARLAGQGEVIVGISFLHDGIKYREEGMKDLILTSPKEGTGYEVGSVAMLNGGPDEEAAKQFIDFVLSKKGQELGETVGSYQFLTNTDAKDPALAEELKDTKLIDYDLDWAGKNRSELVEKWNKAIN
ncbi:ABC transporter substrate-binding protein [Clostridium gasigenes]|uniref:Iron(III) transport system substrate-binding protein n=1 Tax=Clostridium gasigenes TaxID=94869 RepID=A0A1H0VNA5_9CLOT|nr:ABC transporter substrate-binding protein [Clostridium gasigenes]MBU3089594.1 ABC transporter substrate-binding protein [Clostridium gasigenes]MBU3134256.1 ABC transporter substrate-binding protein [Clostridium gasigenes]SDP79987.1 iron(III) transport system substrate-binding protein [Clostridium gasigenes]